MLYGPFKVGGKFVGTDGGAGNAKFDAKLRSTNPAWGIRDIDEVSALASGVGLTLKTKVDMPANNLTLHFIKGGAAPWANWLAAGVCGGSRTAR